MRRLKPNVLTYLLIIIFCFTSTLIHETGHYLFWLFVWIKGTIQVNSIFSTNKDNVLGTYTYPHDIIVTPYQEYMISIWGIIFDIIYWLILISILIYYYNSKKTTSPWWNDSKVLEKKPSFIYVFGITFFIVNIISSLYYNIYRTETDTWVKTDWYYIRESLYQMNKNK